MIGLVLLTSLSLGAPPSAEAQATLEAGGCTLCHSVPGVTAAPREASCHTCHTWIRAVASDPAKRARAMQIFPKWERYEHTVASYMQVPSLEAARARLEPSWVSHWLADPHDVRPALSEGMPRFDLDDEQRESIAEWLAAGQATVAETPPPSTERIDAGRALYAQKGCPACHTFGAQTAAAPNPMAPDLAVTRHRMTPDRVAAWIQDPQQVSSAATMPAMGVSAEEAVAIRDYLLLSDPGGRTAAPLGPAPEPVQTPVTWADVESRVFGKICVHCHMKPALNQGRAGPGNAGGFGWDATGIELQTYEGVAAAADLIPDALLRRRLEAHRDVIAPGEKPAEVLRPTKPGMPLGLPPLPDEDIALVLGWLQQGMPR
ncbi:MAG: c-type cytochrome [Myxococcota bacterium]